MAKIRNPCLSYVFEGSNQYFFYCPSNKEIVFRPLSGSVEDCISESALKAALPLYPNDTFMVYVSGGSLQYIIQEVSTVFI